jgi:hypothetical protein
MRKKYLFDDSNLYYNQCDDSNDCPSTVGAVQNILLLLFSCIPQPKENVTITALTQQLGEEDMSKRY